MNSERRFGFVLSLAAVALSLLSVLALGASPASAEKTRPYTGTSFGPEGTAGSATFKSLQAVTVDQANGDVYVLDADEGDRVYKFDQKGTK